MTSGAPVTMARGELGFRDDREFSLFTYRPGHTSVVVRGFPTMEEIENGDGTGVVRDLLFTGVWRIACWKDIGPIRLRRATGEETAELAGRIGEIRPDMGAYLLKPDSLETHVVASGVTWADYAIPLGAESPLLSAPGQGPAPIDGTIRYAS